MTTVSSKILTQDSIEVFRLWCSERGLSGNTTRAYSTDLRMLLKESGLTSLSQEHFASRAAAWLNTAQRQKSPATLHRRKAACREYARFAELGEILIKHKMPTSAPRQPHPLPGLYDDLMKLMHCCVTDEQRTLVSLCGLEGLRVGEALDTSVDDINFRDRSLHVWGKGAKKRVIPFTDEACSYILPRLLDVRISGKTKLVDYTDSGARNFITTLGVTAGIGRPISSHDLRATFATLAYAQEKDAKAVQYWLGHASGDTTDIYINIPLETMRKIGNFGAGHASSGS
jgi:integrase